MKYSRPTKLLHALFAFGITLQLLLSLVMRQPRAGRSRTAFETLTFTTHEYAGLAIVAILVLHWILNVAARADRSPAHFFPWFSRERLGRLKAEVRDLMRMKLAEPEGQDAIAGAIQGLGLVIATLLAVTGGIIFFGMADDGTMSESIRSIRKVHTTIAPLMWGYLGIHIAAAIAHVAVGHRSILAIFRLRGD